MRNMKYLSILLLAVFMLFVGSFFPALISKEVQNMDKIHTLKYPLFIENENNNGYYLLPKGATLYFDGSMDEGFSRYRLYLNIYGKQLELSENTSGAIIPTGATGIDNTQLRSILKTAKLDANDIKTIIENGNFTDSEKLEIQKILNKKQ